MTSQGTLRLIMIATIAYLLSPLVVGGLLYYELQAGAFPPDSDAIAIPFMGYMILWFAGLVVGAAIMITLAFYGVFSTKD